MKTSNLIVTTSWDDGPVTDLKLAALLKKYGIKGTFYISRPAAANLLLPHDIKTLDTFVEIGAHTMNHVNLSKIALDHAKHEIQTSKTYLENLLGHRVDMFCYPGGSFNKEVKEIVKESGFIGARTCIPKGFELPRDNFQWHMTFLASNGSPLMALKILIKAHLLSPAAFFDWEIRGKLLFNRALKYGGVYHIYGHSYELEINHEWEKIERLLAYVAGRKGVRYLTNGQTIKSASS